MPQGSMGNACREVRLQNMYAISIKILINSTYIHIGWFAEIIILYLFIATRYSIEKRRYERETGEYSYSASRMS